MCGITGVIDFSGIKFQELIVFTNMLVQTETRGPHATGVGLQSMEFYKRNVKASEFVRTQDYADFITNAIGQQWMIGHCRFATRGSPEQNYNNHPIVKKDENGVHQFMVTHNGVVWSDKIKTNIERTDTYTIAKAVKIYFDKGDSLFDSVRKAYNDFSGSATVAIISPKEIVLAKRFNPLWLANYGPATLYASEKRFFPKKAYNIREVADGAIIGWDVTGHKRTGVVKRVPNQTWEQQHTLPYRPSWKASDLTPLFRKDNKSSFTIGNIDDEDEDY